MNKEQFVANYVSTFLASYMASRYDNDCINGHQGEPYNHQPIEDAMFLAEKAWEQYYNPYEIGIRLYKEGHGISSIWGAVECDDDMEECHRGYSAAKDLHLSK